MANIKLTDNELREVKLMKSYFSSLDLDIESPEDVPKAEEDFLNGFSKLIQLYEMSNKQKMVKIHLTKEEIIILKGALSIYLNNNIVPKRDILQKKFTYAWQKNEFK